MELQTTILRHCDPKKLEKSRASLGRTMFGCFDGKITQSLPRNRVRNFLEPIFGGTRAKKVSSSIQGARNRKLPLASLRVTQPLKVAK